MKGHRADLLVGRLAEVAGRAPEITAYVLVYQTKSGAICYHRDGYASSQLGMVEAMKTGIIKSLTNEEED